MEATAIVHWPGKDTPACPAHQEKLLNLAVAMGFAASYTLIAEGAEPTPCANCENERAASARALGMVRE